MTTLISFLGKGRREKESNKYQRATYRFQNGSCVTSSYFGLALARQLNVQKLVILGTAGSIWDVFAEDLADDETALSRLAELRLDKAVVNESVEQAMLDTLAPMLCDKASMQIEPVLIPYAQSESEQLDVLRRMADHVESNDRVVLDVTHGFRHLPMLALVAARFLGRVRNVTVENIYYGALEMTDKRTGETPVVSLNGLLNMLDWVDALAAYDKDGDYGVFAPLLDTDGMDPKQSDLLTLAAYFERTNNPVKARETLGSVLPAVEQHKGSTGLLFRDDLTKRISWIRNNRRSQWELSLADAYLARRDYVRATMFMQEARTSWEVEQRNQDVNDFSTRDKWREQCQKDNNDFKQLIYLRNALAHGVKSTDEKASKALRDESGLRDVLARLRQILFSKKSVL